jgi:F0F1-type ATP synthase assembly protein I
MALLAWVAWEVVALTGAGTLLGWALYRWVGAPLLLTAAFGLLGLVAAFLRIYRASKTMENQK